jgi:amino acid transporter
MSSSPDAVGAPTPGEAAIPIFTRKATGLVRQVSLPHQLLFNAASTTPLGAAIVFGLFALILFPRSNIYVATAIAIAGALGAWVTIALLTAAIPRIGGDYTINTRILHPAVGLAGNLSVYVSTAIASGLAAVWVATQALSPVFLVIGSVTHSHTMLTWGTYLNGSHHKVAVWLIAMAALLVNSVLSILGTRLLMRVMSALFVIAALGFVIDMLILLFTSHSSFVSSVNDAAGKGTYTNVVAAGHKAGLATGGAGYSTKSTIGAIYSMIGVTLFVWWGTYLSSEFRGAGQRRRQLSTILGAGIGQGLLVLLGVFIFLHRVGHDFFASALAGNYSQGGGTVGTAGYAYFSALVASNTAAVIFLALLFLGWWLPLLNVNLAMTQRAVFTWSFDGLLPKRFGEVNERYHTPVIAIATSIVTGGACAAWVAWGGANFFKIFAIMQFFAYIPIAVMGISAMVFKWRRPDLYEGSPAQWRAGGVEVLPIAGALALVWACFAIFLVFYFHVNLGLVGGYYTATYIAPFAVWAVAGVWWYVARAVRLRQGVDLGLAYRVIPPD